jgi:CheY-like chemotaxis protein
MYVRADPQRMIQVLINLISNAIKYNRPQGEVRLACVELPDDLMRLQVVDTGPGIPAEQQHLLFTPFERLGASATDIQGTGLGLALSRNLVHSMGGRIGVESAAGEGSTFWVEMRRVQPEAVVRTVEEPEGVLVSRTYTTQRRLLYVEDVVANVRLVEEILERRPSITVLPAMQGSLGVELAGQHLPDLILLDLHLPDVSGTEVLATLRESPETRDIPVVILTADATRQEQARVADLGAQDYVTKPIGVRQLLELVDRYLAD